ncbi:unnamed protein product [Brassica rapa subsp. narinosa]
MISSVFHRYIPRKYDFLGISSEYFHLTGQTSRQIFREN